MNSDNHAATYKPFKSLTAWWPNIQVSETERYTLSMTNISKLVGGQFYIADSMMSYQCCSQHMLCFHMYVSKTFSSVSHYLWIYSYIFPITFKKSFTSATSFTRLICILEFVHFPKEIKR